MTKKRRSRRRNDPRLEDIGALVPNLPLEERRGRGSASPLDGSGCLAKGKYQGMSLSELDDTTLWRLAFAYYNHPKYAMDCFVAEYRARPTIRAPKFLVPKVGERPRRPKAKKEKKAKVPKHPDQFIRVDYVVYWKSAKCDTCGRHPQSVGPDVWWNATERVVYATRYRCCECHGVAAFERAEGMEIHV